MKFETQYHWGIGVLLSFFIICSCSSENQSQINQSQIIDKIKPQVLPKPNIFIDFEQNGLVQPSSIEMLDKTNIAILDSKLNEVLVFNNRGEFELRFGGEGKGPGEFSNPRYIERSLNYINVIDASLYRVHQFDYSGNFEQSFKFEENLNNSTIAVMDDGKYFAGSMGKKGSLVKLTDTKNDTVKYFGEAMGEAGEETSRQRIEVARQTLASGEIPDVFKNRITLYHENKYVYVFLEAYSRLQKYTTGGELLWETVINLPLNKVIFQKAVEGAKSATSGAISVYGYLTNMKVVDGQVFLLWSPVNNYPRKLLKINNKGEVTNIYHIPEENATFVDFAISLSGNKLYLSAPGKGQVYQTEFQN